MSRLVFVESSCLVDTWSMATRLVRAVRGDGVTDAIRVLEAESARGTDPVSVHRALWALVDGYDHPAPTALPARGASSCVDRDDPLGRAALRALRWHRRAGDRIVVVSDLMPVLARPLRAYLRVDRVLCGRQAPDPAGYPEILLGAVAARAVESVARREAVPLADCVAYGRDPRDRELLRVVGHPVRIGYDGELRLPVPGSADEASCIGVASMPAVRPIPHPTSGRRPAWNRPATA